MKNKSRRLSFIFRFFIMLFTGMLGIGMGVFTVWAGSFMPITIEDQTPTEPLSNPNPTNHEPRYLSGFGSDDTFTIFFEDRSAGGRISYVSTTTGPTGFQSSAITTNIIDTHFLVKESPINIAGTDYAYRAWGAVGNNLDHHFYVANDLADWTLISTFTITNDATFSNAKGWAYYGFHDVIQINGTFYAFAESNQSQTMLVRSTNGDDVWEAFASIGGSEATDGPLQLPTGVTIGWTPSGSFFDLGDDRGWGKLQLDPRDQYFYLAVNTATLTSMAPVDFETAFLDIDNWTWHDDTTGPAASPIMTATIEHDLRESWLVPTSDPTQGWVIIYDADFGGVDGDKALGYTMLPDPTAILLSEFQARPAISVEIFYKYIPFLMVGLGILIYSVY